MNQKTKIIITSSQTLYNYIKSHQIQSILFFEVLSQIILEYDKINILNIQLRYYDNYIYYLINLNNNKYYGKMRTSEININIPI